MIVSNIKNYFLKKHFLEIKYSFTIVRRIFISLAWRSVLFPFDRQWSQCMKNSLIVKASANGHQIFSFKGWSSTINVPASAVDHPVIEREVDWPADVVPRLLILSFICWPQAIIKGQQVTHEWKKRRWNVPQMPLFLLWLELILWAHQQMAAFGWPTREWAHEPEEEGKVRASAEPIDGS